MSSTRQKTNIFNPSYIGERNDLLDLVFDNVSKALDVGCSYRIVGDIEKINLEDYLRERGIHDKTHLRFFTLIYITVFDCC